MKYGGSAQLEPYCLRTASSYSWPRYLFGRQLCN